MFRFNQHHKGAHYLSLLKLQVVSLVVWLHVLLGPYWCMYVHYSEQCTYIRQQPPNNICSHTTKLTTPMYFN